MAKQEKLVMNDVFQCSTSEAVDIISSAYLNVVLNNKDISSFPSIMMWGQPGVGKSQSVKEVCKIIEEKSHKKCHYHEVRLLLMNPIDLRGIPIANKEKSVSEWLIPEIFKMDPSDDVVNVLFLDEISAAPQSVQASAYQLTLDKKVGEHSLPKNCFVIAAGNRVTDKSVAYKMPKALANRFIHFEMTNDFELWKEWGILHAHPLVVSFLAFKPDYLNTYNPSDDSLTFTTPRSWEMVSNILFNVSEDVSKVKGFIYGLIGKGIGSEFISYSKIIKGLPKTEDIFEGKPAEVPPDNNQRYALITSMVQYAKRHTDDINKIMNSIKYGSKFPKEFFALLMQEYSTFGEDFVARLIKEPSFIKYNSEAGVLLNGQKNGFFK